MDREENVKYLETYFRENVPEKYLNYYETAKKLYLDCKIRQYTSLEEIVIQSPIKYSERKVIRAIKKLESKKINK